MGKKSGILLIICSFIITFVSWLFVQPIKSIPIASQYSQLIGTLALVGFAWVNFISTRHPVLEKTFNGLDETYIYHKYLSIISLMLVFIHKILIDMGKREAFSQAIRHEKNPFGGIGSISMMLFIALIIIALVAKKLNYERWKLVHKFMFVPYVIGLVHYYGSSNYAIFGVDPFSIFVNLINFIGIISVVYSIFIYERSSFKYRFKVEKLDYVSKGMLEITGRAEGDGMDFSPGQFAFLKLTGKNKDFPSHPFTISQAPKKGEIQFTIKALGDHTKTLLETIKVGDDFLVSGPHGRFNYRTGSKNQIWIAGGIGITPFRSFYQSTIPADYSIDFFYAFNNKDEAAYVEEIMSMPQKNNLRFYLLNSEKEGFLSAEKIVKNVNEEGPVDVYFCGPKPMRESLKNQLKSSKLKVINFHYEHFQFK